MEKNISFSGKHYDPVLGILFVEPLNADERQGRREFGLAMDERLGRVMLYSIAADQKQLYLTNWALDKNGTDYRGFDHSRFNLKHEVQSVVAHLVQQVVSARNVRDNHSREDFPTFKDGYALISGTSTEEVIVDSYLGNPVERANTISLSEEAMLERFLSC